MTKSINWIVPAALAAIGIAFSPAVRAADWTAPAEVTFNRERCISYRARLSGSYLAVEAVPAPGWHTFAMDNVRRATEKLEGKKALSQDMPTQITVDDGLEVEGPWYQSPPKDFSRPELRWFSWGFDSRALFMAKVRRSRPRPTRIGIHGQVCTESTCRRVDLSISLPPGTDAGSDTSDAALQTLIPVR